MDKKIDSRQREFFESKQATLKKYQDILERSEPAKRYIIKLRSKTGHGLRKTKVVFYNSPDELIDRLHILDAAKQASNTGINNDIMNLDKLLEIDRIDKTTYDKLHKNIFLI